MPFQIRCVDYFYATVPDQPGEAYRLLSVLEKMQINLVAFTIIPMGNSQTQLAIFPEESGRLTQAAEQAGLALEGPHPAILVQGDDKVGALAEVHQNLYRAHVNVYAATGVTASDGGFGYIVYVGPEQQKQAAAALGISSETH